MQYSGTKGGCAWHAVPCWHWGTPSLTSGQGGGCAGVPGAGDGFVGVSEASPAPISLLHGTGGAGCPPVPGKGDRREVTCSMRSPWPARSSGSCSNLLRPRGLLTTVLE